MLNQLKDKKPVTDRKEVNSIGSLLIPSNITGQLSDDADDEENSSWQKNPPLPFYRLTNY